MKRYVAAGIVVGSLAALVAGIFATGSAQQMSADDIVAERQRVMKLNGASWQDAHAKLKAGSIEAVAVNAETMAMMAREIPKLFPAGSMNDKSKAKPEIWQKWPEFEAAAKNLRTQAEKLRDTAKTGDAASTQAVVQTFGRNACGTCHQPFRVPPPPQPQR